MFNPLRIILKMQRSSHSSSTNIFPLKKKKKSSLNMRFEFKYDMYKRNLTFFFRMKNINYHKVNIINLNHIIFIKNIIILFLIKVLVN